MKKIVFVICSLLLLSSCDKGKKKEYKVESVGAANGVTVVIDNDLWKGDIGDRIRNYFAAPVDGLPWQEPLFTIHQMPPQVFTDFAQKSRNVFVVSNKVANNGIKTNVYSQPQIVGFVNSENHDKTIKAIDSLAPLLVKKFKEGDILVSQSRFKESENHETALKDKMGITMSMPSIYKTRVQEDDFIWIERQIPKGTMNIIVYEMPYNFLKNDSTKVDQIIKMRDSIGQLHVPGREEGMYMITEKSYAPYIYDTKIAGREATEVKGMWEVKNFFMAGPFVNFIIPDKKNNRDLVVEGFTFAPSTNKRDYMFQLESILRSIKFEGEDNPKNQADYQ
ncbi:DUF4837 family protein [Zhouia sp. PK063]|uniref:DUF4837 family protein n=1 Tax=Zhouia sp. PK063 TaxID=3373602 RepID=UPI0037B4C1B8